MKSQHWKKEICTIPNLLSLFRILLIPVYLKLYQRADSPAGYLLAAGVLGLSCLTDWLDGWVAREFHMRSSLGRVLDPAADKLTQLALAFCLARRHPSLRWMLLFLGIKEGLQILAGALFLLRGRLPPGPVMEGKICTTVMYLSMTVLVLCPGLPETAVGIIGAVDTVFLATAFLSYMLLFLGWVPQPRADA